MEKKKLDFNAPLLSVRRSSLALLHSSDRENRKKTESCLSNKRNSLPPYKSDLIPLSQVENPATVPFLWEQLPGKTGGGFRAKTAPREDPYTSQLKSLKERINDDVDHDFPSGNADDVEDDAAYSDALSHAESLSLSCRVSSFSGPDGPEVKPSRTFSMDPETWHFIMSRFLPAAKAMIVEMPQYASRKQVIALDQHREDKDFENGDRRPPFNQYGSNVISHLGQNKRENENVDDDYSYDEHGILSTNNCGLFAQFRLNKSLCLTNPVPDIQVATHVPTSSSENVSNCQSHYKHAIESDYRHKTNIDGDQLKEKGKEFFNSSNPRTTCGSSPYRRPVSPYRNERPQSPFREGVGFLGVPKTIENCKANKFHSQDKDRYNSRDSVFHRRDKILATSRGPTVEKRSYVDSAKSAEARISNSSSSDTKGAMESLAVSNEKLVQSRNIEQTTTSESGYRDSKVPTDGNLDNKNNQLLREETQGNLYSGILNSSLHPPLPKSPTESWLLRALPSVSPRNSFSFIMKQKVPKTTETKWETIVKTSNMHHDRVRFSQELVSNVPQKPKT